MSTGSGKSKPGSDVFEAINAAKESVDRGIKGSRHMPKKLSKKLPSTSSNGSTKGNEAKAKNFYNRMNLEHKEAMSKQPTSLREARNKYKSEKTDTGKNPGSKFKFSPGQKEN